MRGSCTPSDLALAITVRAMPLRNAMLSPLDPRTVSEEDVEDDSNAKEGGGEEVAASFDRQCPVCLETDRDSEREWTSWDRCGHFIHTSCALQSALHGTVTCAICRDLLVEDQEEVEERREAQQERVYAARRQESVRRALSMQASRQPPPLRRAVSELRRAMQRLKDARSHRSRAQRELSQERRRMRARKGCSNFCIHLHARVDDRVIVARCRWRSARCRVQDEMDTFMEDC